MVIVTIMLKSLKISEAGQVGEFLEQVGHEVYLADGQIEIKLFLALHSKYYYHIVIFNIITIININTVVVAFKTNTDP